MERQLYLFYKEESIKENKMSHLLYYFTKFE